MFGRKIRGFATTFRVVTSNCVDLVWTGRLLLHIHYGTFQYDAEATDKCHNRAARSPMLFHHYFFFFLLFSELDWLTSGCIWCAEKPSPESVSSYRYNWNYVDYLNRVFCFVFPKSLSVNLPFISRRDTQWYCVNLATCAPRGSK